MLNETDTTFQPRKPFRRRERAKLPSAGPAGLTIVEVQRMVINEQIKVYFSGPVSWNGVDIPSSFKADTSDGPLDSCINVLSVGADWIELEFNGAVTVGGAWALEGPMAGISPAVSFPQSGTVTA